MVYAPLGPHPLPGRIGNLRVGDVCWGGLVCKVGPRWRIEVAESFGGEEGYAAEETAPLVFVEDVDGGFGGG